MSSSKKKVNSDGLFLVGFFSVVSLIVIAIAWFNQGRTEVGRYTGGSAAAQKEQSDMQGILIIATVTILTVIFAIICKKIANKRKARKKAKILEARREAIQKQREAAEQAQLESILAIGRKTLESRNYHKSYGKDDEYIDVKERRMNMAKKYEEYEEDEEDEYEAPKNKLFFAILAGIMLIGIGFMIGVFVL